MNIYKAEVENITAQLKKQKRFVKNAVNFNGFEWIVPDVASFCAQLQEIFIDEVYAFDSSTENPTIIDCGSNIGISIAYFKILFPKAHIIGFEADPDIFAYLIHNTKQFQNIELHNQAVWCQNGQMRFFCQGADGGSLINQFKKECSVPTTRLKDVLMQYNQIDFLKIDIEGAETEVIKDCADDLKKAKNIFVEYHSIKGHPQTLDIILNILSQNGFRYYLEGLSKGQISPLVTPFENVGMDLQVSIWGKKDIDF